jgi:protein TonB
VKVKRTTGLAILDEAAEQTIKTWTFEPGRRGPDPVESWVEVPVRFSLKQR